MLVFKFLSFFLSNIKKPNGIVALKHDIERLGKPKSKVHSSVYYSKIFEDSM